MNQLRDFVTGDSIEFQCWKKAGRICRRNRPCPRFWLQHNFWLQYNPLAHLVQEFKVSAHDAPTLFLGLSAEIVLKNIECWLACCLKNTEPIARG